MPHLFNVASTFKIDKKKENEKKRERMLIFGKKVIFASFSLLSALSLRDALVKTINQYMKKQRLLYAWLLAFFIIIATILLAYFWDEVSV